MSKPTNENEWAVFLDLLEWIETADNQNRARVLACIKELEAHDFQVSNFNHQCSEWDNLEIDITDPEFDCCPHFSTYQEQREIATLLRQLCLGLWITKT